jgi:lipid-A-disaccharide synthase
LKIAVCAGEKSGDALGYELLVDLKENIENLEVIGVGGSLMEGEGLKSFFPIKEISYMGLIDPLLNLRKILKIRKNFINFLKIENPDIFIGIDSPSFNSGICKVLRRETNIKTVQYVCPQFWAWRYGRVHKFNSLYHRIFSLFPFESQLLKKHGVNFSYVGHPLARNLSVDSNKEALKKSLGIPLDKKVIAILPGSRKSEIFHHSKPLADFINTYKKQNADEEIILALNKESDLLGELKQLSKKISVIYDSTQKVLASCDMAVVASGTATLEAAILAKPMVVIYKSNKLSNFILSNFFLKTKFISLPNILSQEEIVFELRQNQVSGKEIGEKVELTFKNQEIISDKLSSIRDSLLVTDSNKFSVALREILAK